MSENEKCEWEPGTKFGPQKNVIHFSKVDTPEDFPKSFDLRSCSLARLVTKILNLFQWKPKNPKNCKHDWEEKGTMQDHPAFEIPNTVTFLHCPLCESRNIRMEK